ncbi:hypothetical protein [Flavobacterium sp. CS20]|jgi:hypothetical protein|uniref:hypothetical protein n=1 Tax=Flavobacterium sp. CS20 TaxID=2775246 RepID=UPI001B3A38C2|nr:hypothetical protein [Flavobacterium sp. CS20]QTY27406.1 hypothetical protein IGB25_02210 [Flavobacterium sp. CS20]
MDELELLKQDWKRQEKNLPHVKTDEIYKMMHKKSTSIVKWIFIISIAEFVFWLGLDSLSFFDNSLDIIQQLGLESFYRISLIVNYAMIVIFIGLFFRNFKKISTDDNVKSLMKNIITTRKTVKAYVWFNVIIFGISFVIVSIATLNQTLENQTLEAKLLGYGILVVILSILLLIIFGFYRLLYGFLTRRLYKNYKVLKKLDQTD